MELDTDVLRSSYLADIPHRHSYSSSFPVQWEKTLCPDPVIVEADYENQYRVDVVHVKNTAFCKSDGYDRITSNTDTDWEQNQPSATDHVSKQTISSEFRPDQEVVLDSYSGNISAIDSFQKSLNNEPGCVDMRSIVCLKGRRKRQYINLNDSVKTQGKSDAKVQEEDKEPGCTSEKQMICDTIFKKPRQMNAAEEPDKYLTENQSSNHVPQNLNRKYVTDQTRFPPTFRFGHYTYEQKTHNHSNMTSVNSRRSTVTFTNVSQNQVMGDVRGHCGRASWNIPENRGNSKNDRSLENPLASLSRYCETMSSREASDLRSLTDELVTSKYNAFVESQKIPDSVSSEGAPTPSHNNKVRYGPLSNTCGSGLHGSQGSALATSDNQVFVENETVSSLSYSKMLFSFHSDVLARRRMMMNEWHCERKQGNSKSWHKPAQSEFPQSSQKDANHNNKSRLFGISISRSCDTSCLVSPGDKAGNKENLPQISTTYDTDGAAGMNDSGLGTLSTNSSFETDVEILHVSTGSENEPIISNTASDTPLAEDHISGAQVITGGHLTRQHTSPGIDDMNSAVFGRRKYILDAKYTDHITSNPQSYVDSSTHWSPEIPDSSVQVSVSPPELLTRTDPPILQHCRGETITSQAICGVTPPPLQDNSGRGNSSVTETSDNSDIRDFDVFPNQTKVPGALSDFKALVDAFDKSPVKSTHEESDIRKTYPVLEAALYETSVDSIAQNHVQHLPKKVPKTDTCQYCGKRNLTMKAVRRHKLRRYSCPVCEERFCLQDLLNKHAKEKSCFAVKQTDKQEVERF